MKDFTKLLKKMGVTFEKVNDNEIIIPCPLGAIPNYEERKNSFTQNEEMPEDFGIIDDWVEIWITKDEEGNFNFLVMTEAPLEEEDK